jgi:hypothetical protein
MNKFFNWLRYEKSIVSTHILSYVDTRAFVIEQNGVIYSGADTTIKELPKQMLVGYMIEYLQDNKVDFEISSSKNWNITEVLKVLEDKINQID